MNGILIKVVPSVDGFRYILNECMRDSFGNELEIDYCVGQYERGECELWTVPEVGFIVVSLHKVDNVVYLDVNYAAGKGLYHPDNMETLYKMASGYGAEFITCSTMKRGNVRLLQRAGYVVDKVERGRTYLIRTLNNGRFKIQQQYQQHDKRNDDYNKPKCDRVRRWHKCSRRWRYSGGYRFDGV